jgi:hypothetical protein
LIGKEENNMTLRLREFREVDETKNLRERTMTEDAGNVKKPDIAFIERTSRASLMQRAAKTSGMNF